MAKSNEEKYTDPGLREEIKEEIKASDKSGKKGQWSARKSQLLTREYEKRGGGYKGDKDESQENLSEWTGEEWQTKEGDADARQEGGETRRYLPKKAWENMSEEEKEETEERKREGSMKGEQYVSNTDEAKDARKKAQSGREPIRGYDGMSVGEIKEKLDGRTGEKLEEARAYEEENSARRTLLRWLDGRIGGGT